MIAFFAGRLQDNQFHDISKRIIRLGSRRALDLLQTLGFEEVTDAGYLPIEDVRKATVMWLRSGIKKNNHNGFDKYVLDLSKAASNRTGTHIFWG